MGKISNIMENGIAGLVGTLEFRRPSSRKNALLSHTEAISIEKRSGFKSFILGEKKNRRYLIIAIIGIILQFILLKLLFPFPDFISDSYNYLESAIFHLDVNLWPIGYAKFLWLIHQINYSDSFLVATQYILLQCSLLYFFYTIIYIFKPSRLSSNILFVFLLFNPIFLYLSNCVLSDSIFTAITIVWLSLLIWQIYRPNIFHIILSAILIGLAFTIRYTAIYYPIILVVALALSQYKTWVKILGAISPMIFIIPFVLFTEAKTKAITGTAEFSVFGGWQIANNALYMYRHIDVNPQHLPSGTEELDRMVKQYYKTMPPEYFNFDDFPGTFFIKHAEAPLKQYMLTKYKKEHDTSSFLGWGKVSPIYNKYGTYLIKQYPIAFMKSYIWLNVQNYFVPFLEKFGSYNVEMDSVWYPAQYWFHYNSPSVKVVSKDLQGVVFFAYRPAFLLLNIYFLSVFVWMILRSKMRHYSSVFTRSLWLTAVFLLINFCFSIFATPVVLRYQIISLVLLFSFSTLLFEFTDSEYLQSGSPLLRPEYSPVLKNH